jgi:hypothetical protein
MTKATYKELTAKASEVMEQCYYMRNDLADLGNDLSLTPETREALVLTLNQLNYEATALLQTILQTKE